MNINTYINKYLIYLNYINLELNISYSIITYTKYSYKYNTMVSTINLTKWKKIRKKGEERNIILQQWKDLKKNQLLEILQSLAENVEQDLENDKDDG